MDFPRPTSLCSFLLVPTLLGLAACGETPTDPAETLSSDGMGGARTEIQCETSSECDDGNFCNGEEFCAEGYCSTGARPDCDDGIDCTLDACSHAQDSCVHLPEDSDGDGHAAATCLDPDGSPLGDDCDDDDANRYPGNDEVCAVGEETHDEDCIPTTVGYRDADLDGETSIACCNGEGDDAVCGPDCNDDDYRQNSSYPEICDEIDNDCDGRVDVDTKEVPWFSDADGDHFGDGSDEPILSCAPIEGRSLRDSDCNDGTAAIHSAALEICDQADNDCDGEVDEDNVCACAVEGQVQACACSAGFVGSQRCVGGEWNACDCSECVDGQLDCLGELLPRECVDGRWQVGAACRGLHPICLEGSCVCADGTMDCVEIVDTVGPVLVASEPTGVALGRGNTTLDVDEPLVFIFNEPILPSSAAGNIVLQDNSGAVLDGLIVVGGNTVSFQPNEPLGIGHQYQVQVGSAITDLQGNTGYGSDPVTFTTNLQVPPTRVLVASGQTLRSPSFGGSPGGTVALAATRFSDEGMSHDGTFFYDWNGSSFDEEAQITTDSQQGHLAVDDSGRALFVDQENGATEYYDYDGTNWSFTLTYGGPFRTFSSSLAGSGLGLTTFSNGTSIFSCRRATKDTDETCQGYGITAILSLDSATNGSRGLITYQNGGSIDAWSGPLDATWGAPVNISGGFQTTAAMDDAGQGYIAYERNYAFGAGAYNQVFLQRVDATGAVVGSEEHAGAEQERNETFPQLAATGSGNALVVFFATSGGQTDVIAVNRGSAGAWGPEHILTSTNVGETLEDLRLALAEDGSAFALWLLTPRFGGAASLWGAKRETDGTWLQAQLIETGSDAIAQHFVAVDDSGRFVVVFEQGEVYYVAL